MPGYVIHLAIGQEYAKRNRIENTEEFLKGCIAPDMLDKSQSHYFDEDRSREFAKIFRRKYNKYRIYAGFFSTFNNRFIILQKVFK